MYMFTLPNRLYRYIEYRDISNIVIYRCITIKLYTYTYKYTCSYTFCMAVNFTVLQLFVALILENSFKSHLIHTQMFRTIYCCLAHSFHLVRIDVL